MNEQSMGADRPKLKSISDLFKGSWEEYKQHAQVLISIMLIAGIGLYLQTILLFTAGPTVQFNEFGMTSTAGMSGSYAMLTLLAGIVYAISMIWGYSALLNKVSKLSQPMDVKQAFVSAKPLIWPLFLTGLLAGIFTLIGFVLLVIPAIIVGVFLSFALYIVVDEHKKGMEALKASKAYVEGYWWPVFGRVIIIALTIGIISGIIGGIAQGVLGYKVGMLFQNVVSLAITPFAVLYMYNLYKNVKQIKGGSTPMPSAVPSSPSGNI